MDALTVLWLVQMWAQESEVDEDESWGPTAIIYFPGRGPEMRALAMLSMLRRSFS